MNRNLFQIVLVVYLLLILVLSTIPGRAIPRIEIWSFDKILHIIEYFILAFLGINAIKNPSKKNILLIIWGGIIYGGFNEYWQYAVSSRSASLYDAIANGIGMYLGSIITYKYLIFTND